MLIHYSPRPVLEVRDADLTKLPGVGKPPGFWVSVDDAWKRFCETDFKEILRDCRVAHEVTLQPDANVLRIGSAEQLHAFTAQYKKDDKTIRRTFSRFDMIDWAPVMAQYDGIIIAPYLWSCRMNVSWYYGWDVASGVFWRARAIKSIRVIPHDEIPAYENEDTEEQTA